MPELSPPSSINDLRAQGIYAITRRYGALDLTPLLLYTIKFAPKSALKWLAWQFDMLDPRWQLLGGTAGESIAALRDIAGLTDIGALDSPGSEAGPSDYDSLRVLLPQAIPLHRKRGTPAAILTALSALGWPSATLQEGQNSWGGTSYPANQGWAVFRVLINLAAGSQPASWDDVTDIDTLIDIDPPLEPGETLGGGDVLTVNATQLAAIIAAVNFFKPARCKLDQVIFAFPGVSDRLLPAPSDFVGVSDLLLPAPRDSFVVVFPGVSDNYSHTPLHDAQFQRAGITYANQPVGPTDGASTFNGAPVEGNQ